MPKHTHALKPRTKYALSPRAATIPFMKRHPAGVNQRDLMCAIRQAELIDSLLGLKQGA